MITCSQGLVDCLDRALAEMLNKGAKLRDYATTLVEKNLNPTDVHTRPSCLQ